MTKQEKIEQAKALHCEGFSAIEISERMGVNVRSIQRYLKESPAEKQQQKEEAPSVNNIVDHKLIKLFHAGDSTKYKCFGVIAKEHCLELSEASDKVEAQRLLRNAIKRFHRRGWEFHITPEFVSKAKNSEAMLSHFYDELEGIWHHLEQSIESIVKSHFSEEQTRMGFQIRYEMAKALCLPYSTRTAREQAIERQESYWRTANLREAAKQGIPITMNNVCAVANTEEQLALQQELAEDLIYTTTGITKDDIPY